MKKKWVVTIGIMLFFIAFDSNSEMRIQLWA